jgi:hypothetical protein
LFVPSIIGEQALLQPSGSHCPSQLNVIVYDPVESQKVASFETGSHAPVFGAHVTQPRPSLHSLLHRMTCANDP